MQNNSVTASSGKDGSASAITLDGIIETITFHDSSNGYSVIRLKSQGKARIITAVGYLISPTVGDAISVVGAWVFHKKFGEQFKIESYNTHLPTSKAGILNYLKSGSIKGIGAKTAKDIVAHFGEDTIDVITDTPERLTEIRGIGTKRLAKIKASWQAQQEIRDIMLFLQGHGIGSGYAAKIYKRYESSSIEVVTKNPYQLATDIIGIGFKTADEIAAKLGFEKTDPLRISAGLKFVLSEASGTQGHIFLPKADLIQKASEYLNVDRDLIFCTLAEMLSQDLVVLDNSFNGTGKWEDPIYLKRHFASETGVARRLAVLKHTPGLSAIGDPEKKVRQFQETLGITLSETQVQAVLSAIYNKVSIITGGPGTGKTTIIRSILKIFESNGCQVMMAAPTGRAAKRMSESTGGTASTIHRMLGFSKGQFTFNEENPLPCDVLILDESSMLDLPLAYQLLKAIPSNAALVLVGDINQLPSVGAGSFLKNVIGSGVFPVITLTDIFRQARQSDIVVNAHMINSGRMPIIKNAESPDFFFIEKEDPELILREILSLVSDRIPKRFGFRRDEIQVLAPMKKGMIGVDSLNMELQRILNPQFQAQIKKGARMYRIKDRVICLRNNYDRDVFNGDIGVITDINIEDDEITIEFDGRPIQYDSEGLDEIALAYAMSVHKSQGSEYPAVVMPVSTQHYVMLQRNLVYTGITRGKKLVVLVGTKKAMGIAVRSNQVQDRCSYLDVRLQKAV